MYLSEKELETKKQKSELKKRIKDVEDDISYEEKKMKADIALMDSLWNFGWWGWKIIYKYDESQNIL